MASTAAKKLPVALITGTNSGLGMSLAVKLAKTHTVYAGIRKVTQAKRRDLDEAAEEAKVTHNLNVVDLDVCDDESVAKAIGGAIAKSGRIDLLINNAGYSVFGTVEMLSMNDIQAQFDTNVYGVIRCQKAVLPTMRKQKSGKIINISSVGGVWGQPFNDVYCASKFALEGMTESQAGVFRTFGVYVSCVQPGLITSKFITNAKRPDPATIAEEYQAPIASTMAVYQSGGTDRGQTPDECADEIIARVVDVAEPPVKVQVNDKIQLVFQAQLRDTTGETGVKMQARFLPSTAEAGTAVEEQKADTETPGSKM